MLKHVRSVSLFDFPAWRRWSRTAWLSLPLMLVAAPCPGADSYPDKALRMVVPFAPGGSVDTTARVISQQLSEQLGRQFIIDNRTGASGTIANAIVARSAPDGYTLMIADTSTVIAASLMKSLPFDVVRDFAAITQIMRAPQVLVVNSSLNVNTLKEFVALARAYPGKFNYGSAGASGQLHLVAELFNMAAKIKTVHIPYKGGAEAITALMSGETHMQISVVPTIAPAIKSGKVRALAVTTDGKRVPALPDVPTMSEAGVPDMVMYVWHGLVGPAGMPKRIITVLHAEAIKALALPALKERFSAQGAEVVGSSPEEFSRHIRDELRRLTEVIKVAGITSE